MVVRFRSKLHGWKGASLRRVEFNYVPRSIFVPFHQRTKRWACIVVHRGAGKTVAAINDLLVGSLECRKPSPRFAYVAPFRDQAKRTAWDYLKHYSEPFQRGKPNESELTVVMPNSGKIMLFGADNADALRGIHVDGLILDEFGDFKPSVWGNVIRPTLSARQGWVVFMGTPKGRNEFWKTRELARKNPGDWYFMELRASESGVHSQEELRLAASQITPEQYAQEYECDFAAALPGAYFGREMVQAERDGRITVVEVDPAVPVYTAWDIGYRDDTAIWWYQVLRGEIHVVDYHASSGQSIPFYANLIKDKGYDVKRHWLPHDAKAKTLASGGRSIVEQLAACLGGLGKLAIVPNLDIQDGIQAARVALQRCWFDESKCEEGLEALRQYQREWDDEKKAFRERPRHDWTSHPADAFRMLAVAWREERKEAEPEKGKDIRTVSLDELWEWQKRIQGLERRI